MVIRSPIVCVLGHVDHGKTTLLDAIRGTAVASKEAGKITQMIGASYLPVETIERISEPVRGVFRTTLKIPGLLFIDTPGHEAFTNLRERGGSIADLAVLVVDISQGFQPQTIESVKILKYCKTPFIIAANKLDLVSGWKSQGTYSFLESFAKQPEHVKAAADDKIYSLMGQLSEHGFDCERFDRVEDYTKQVGIIPISSKTKEGLAELLLLIAGLSQKYMEGRLELREGTGKGTVLEVKEEKGLGTTIDVILYDGSLAKGQEIAYLTGLGVQRTKIRALLEPNLSPKSSKDKYAYLDSVHAAAGVKILAPGLEGTIPGSPLVSVTDFERQKREIESHASCLIFEGGEKGVSVKADSLGSIEALLNLLKKGGIAVRKAGVGPVTRKDVMEAASVAHRSRFDGAVLAFNTQVLKDAREESAEAGVPIIWSNVIYKLVEDYGEWKREETEKEKRELMTALPWPSKIKALPGHFFRLSKPAVFGVEVLCGKIRKGNSLMDAHGKILGEIKTVQSEGKSIDEASAGMKVALSSEQIVLKKDLREGDVLYSFMSRRQLSAWGEKTHSLSEKENELLEEIRKIILFSS